MQNNQKKKILYVVTKSNWGGAQRYVFDLSTNFSETYEITVAFGGKGELKTRLENSGIRTITLPFLKRNVNPLADFFTLKKLITLFEEERPDIIHLNSSKIGVLGSIAGRIAKVPKIIFTAHGWAFNEDRGWVSKKIFWFFHWITILLSHQTIAVSKAIERDMIRSPFLKNKITVVSHGVETFTTEDRQTARKKIISEESLNRLPPDTFWIGTISELHSNKGIEYALQAIAKLKKMHPDSSFVFVVMGEGEKRKYLEDLTKKLNLEKIVFLPGHKENARSLLSAFDIFLQSSITEALGLVVIEAGIAKLPVVASGVGGIPEIIKDMESGILVRSKTPEETAKALDFLIFHPAKAKEFGEKLYLQVTQNFSPEKMFDDTKKVYEQKIIKKQI